MGVETGESYGGGSRTWRIWARSRTGWNFALAAYAYSSPDRLADHADLNLWAVMYKCPASARYSELG